MLYLKVYFLSDTRWACRHAAVNALACTYEAVVATLELLTEDNDKNKAVESRGLLLQITSFSFIVSLVVFDRILSCTKSLSDILQEPELDLAKAAEFVTGTIVTLSGVAGF